MSLTTEQTSINTSFTSISDELFYAIIDRLKVQKALPADSFVKQMPFFNFSSVSKESQVRELFQEISDPVMFKSLFKNILSLPDQNNNDLLSKRLSSMQVMGFAQIVLYKVLPCCDENCPNCPREVATRNQYKDYEYECPFYHHDKDQRRMVLESNIEEEFVYKANYCEEKNPQPSQKDKHSQNYFESLYHPLYYKMFRCKREHCNFSQFCPYFHSEEEKKTWDRTFSNFIRKDRVSYVKDKQKYFGQKPNYKNPGTKIVRAGSDSQSNHSESFNINYKQNDKYKTQKSQESPKNQNKGNWRSEKALTPVSKDFDNQRKPLHNRKNSGASSDSNSSPINFGKYYDNKENLNIKRAF